MKLSTPSVGTTSVPTSPLGMPIEKAVLAGIGVFVIASAISYDANKKEVLRNSPYSYLLSMGKAGLMQRSFYNKQ